MKAGEKISVIVPVYQVEAYLPCCLDSILAQTYSNLEIILVDDGSQDCSGEICEMYAKKDTRIKVIHQRNQGVSAARNAGLAIATGEWIGFVDGDDWIDPEMYKYLHGLAKIYDSDLVQCGILCKNQERTVLYAPDKTYKINLSENLSTNKNMLVKYFGASSCCKLFRKKRIARLFFDLVYPIGEDALFSLEALSLCGEIVLGNKVYYHYRQNPDSSSHTIVQNGNLESARKMYQYAEKKFAEQKIILSLCQNYILFNGLDICSKIVCNHIDKMKDPLIKEIRTEMRTVCRNHFAGIDFTTQEQLKCFLIGYLWELYRWGLPKWKELRGIKKII